MFSEDFLRAYDSDRFTSNTPSPWDVFDGLLEDRAFQQLLADFPPLDQFEKHEGKVRPGGQRPHDRFYLALEQSIYGTSVDEGKGCVPIDALAPSWQEFISQIRNDKSYNRFVAELLGVDDYVVRFAWHMASTGCDVSPHIDSLDKYGTHIFYFMSDDNWNEEWGGQTVFLTDKRVEGNSPEMGDFETRRGASIMNNKSMLFRNSESAWHAVAPLRCPEGQYRMIFNVIFQDSRELARANRKQKRSVITLGDLITRIDSRKT